MEYRSYFNPHIQNPNNMKNLTDALSCANNWLYCNPNRIECVETSIDTPEDCQKAAEELKLILIGVQLETDDYIQGAIVFTGKEGTRNATFLAMLYVGRLFDINYIVKRR